MTADERAELVARLRAEGLPWRAIARRLGISNGQVGRDLERARLPEIPDDNAPLVTMQCHRPELRAPFAWPGGKSRVAAYIWQRLGEVRSYVEPFLGSAAVLLARPHPIVGVEVVNDADHLLVNCWRAIQADPEAVARHADEPVHEVAIHARHRLLVLGPDAEAFRRRMEADPDHYDARFAGWWLHGVCAWPGGGWGRVPASGTLKRKRPGLPRGSRTVHYGGGIHARGPDIEDRGGPGTCAARRAWLLDWFQQLRDRLRNVRVCCGSWERVVPAGTGHGVVGLVLDPPYGRGSGRCEDLYAHDDPDVAEQVRAFCIERGRDVRWRIVLCGYVGEGHEALLDHGWSVVRWTAQGGSGNRSRRGRANKTRERLYLSPGCLPHDRQSAPGGAQPAG